MKAHRHTRERSNDKGQRLVADPRALLNALGAQGVWQSRRDLLDCLGMGLGRGPAGAATLAQVRPVLEAYRDQVLVPVELGMIGRAHALAASGQWRELIALDRAIDAEAGFADTREASRRAGLTHLRRLKPLKDLRGLQRYRTAVESREAVGWHFIVYGVILGSFALPLLQGCANYSRNAMTGVARSLVTGEDLAETELERLVESCLEGLDFAAIAPALQPCSAARKLSRS